MLVFRTDEATFGDGALDGARIVSDAGLKIDFDEHLPDGTTPGLWHLHDGMCQGQGTGLEDASGAGGELQNHGAEAVEDGYRLDRSAGTYLDASLPGQPARSALTLECWVRDAAAMPEAAEGVLATVYADANNYLYLQLRRDDANSRLLAGGRGGGAAMSYLAWTGALAGALLEGPDPWHVAAVLDGGAFRLYVGGALRDSGGGGVLVAGDYQLRLGRYWSGWAGYDLSAVLDEVRLSASARYASDFTPHRLRAEGRCASPVCDGVRQGAGWQDLVAEATIPEGSSPGWEVRAADELDGFGNPQGVWVEWDGDPAALPDGRYVQWRSHLTPSPDRLESPTLTAVEAHVSEAGYDLFHGAGPDPDAVDYTSPVLRVGPGVAAATTEPLAPGAVHWFGIRPVDARGRASPTARDEVRVEVDEGGLRIADRPAGVLAAEARPQRGGTVALTWRYRMGVSGVGPATFRIYGDGGTGEIDDETPLGEVSHDPSRRAYAWETPPLEPSGVVHQLAVRAVAPDGTRDEQPVVLAVTPDDAAPDPVDAPEVEVIL